jgi:hypothetical protein
VKPRRYGVGLFASVEPRGYGVPLFDFDMGAAVSAAAALLARFGGRALQRRCGKHGRAERERRRWGENPQVRHYYAPQRSGSRRHSPPLNDQTPRTVFRFAGDDRAKLEVQDLDVTGLNGRGKSKQVEIFFLLPLGHFRVVARELGPLDGEIVVDKCLAEAFGKAAIL